MAYQGRITEQAPTSSKVNLPVCRQAAQGELNVVERTGQVAYPGLPCALQEAPTHIFQGDATKA